MSSLALSEPQQQDLQQQQQQHDGAIAHSQLAHNAFKKLRLQQTFDYLATCLIVFIVALILYYNWLMLAPHITPIIWAALFSIVLYRPLAFITKVLTTVDHVMSDIKLKIYLSSAVVYVLIMLLSSLVTTVVFSTIFGLWTFILFGDRRTVASVVLLLLLLVGLGLPTYYIVSTCVLESKELALKIQHFVDENPQFQTLLEDFGESPYFKYVSDYASTWGIQVPAWNPVLIKSKIIEFSMELTSHLSKALGNVLSLVSSGAQIIVAFITFLTTLFYFLVNMDTLSMILNDVSPFSDEDSDILIGAMHRSVTQIFLSSGLIFLSHLIGTYFVFYITNIELTLFLSLLAGFTSTLPLLGSYIVWIPAALVKIVSGRIVDAILIISVQLILLFVGDSAIYTLIPGNNFLIAFGISMGMYLFGFLGIFLGPLLAGLVVIIVEMYCIYQRLPRLKIKPNEVEIDLNKVDQTLSLSATPSFQQQRSGNRPRSGMYHQPALSLPATPTQNVLSPSSSNNSSTDSTGAIEPLLVSLQEEESDFGEEQLKKRNVTPQIPVTPAVVRK